MKLIHTSDWHLGRKLYGHQRYQEFEHFLHWLGDYIEQEAIDVLLIAGDIFDSNTPSNRAQTLYYQFLHRMAATTCQHIVIIAGNHDSPSLLNAPKDILKFLNVHVIAHITEQLADEVLSLRNTNGDIELIVCAVPYLRDRDIRQSIAGESFEDKESKLKQGIQQHYQQVTAIAETLQANCDNKPPIVAMGHLFTKGGKEGDGVRDLYVGSLAHISPTAFPKNIDYLALGHLHIPQRLAKSNTHRYSGSPLPMSFGEATQQKMIISITFDTNSTSPTSVEEIHLPCFQKLIAIKGDMDSIQTHLTQLKQSDENHWLEISYTGKAIISDLNQQIADLIADSPLNVLRIEDRRIINQALQAHSNQKTLDELQPKEVFQRCLEAHEIPDKQHIELHDSFNSILRSLYETDPQAE